MARPARVPGPGWLAPAGGQAGHRGDDQHPGDDNQRHRGAHVGDRHRPEVINAVAQQRLADELEPDEPEDDGQSGGQVHQPAQQPPDNEVEVTQAEQGEQVGGEDQERVAGEAEDRRYGVDGEQHVGYPDRDDQDEQGCGVAAPPHAGRQPGAVAPGRDRHEVARDPQRAAVSRPGRGATPARRHPHGGIDEERPEEVLHPAEPVQGGTAEADEQAAQHEGEQDPEQQNPAVVLTCHPGGADQEEEHQQVVERQAVFGQPAGEELAGRGPAADGGDQRAERHRQRDRRTCPQRRLAKAGRSTPPGADDKVSAQENGKGRGSRGPGPEGNVEDVHDIRVPGVRCEAGRDGRPG
jgi:hypothetical protein